MSSNTFTQSIPREQPLIFSPSGQATTFESRDTWYYSACLCTCSAHLPSFMLAECRFTLYVIFTTALDCVRADGRWFVQRENRKIYWIKISFPISSTSLFCPQWYMRFDCTHALFSSACCNCSIRQSPYHQLCIPSATDETQMSIFLFCCFCNMRCVIYVNTLLV